MGGAGFVRVRCRSWVILGSVVLNRLMPAQMHARRAADRSPRSSMARRPWRGSLVRARRPPRHVIAYAIGGYLVLIGLARSA